MGGGWLEVKSKKRSKGPWVMCSCGKTWLYDYLIHKDTCCHKCNASMFALWEDREKAWFGASGAKGPWVSPSEANGPVLEKARSMLATHTADNNERGKSILLELFPELSKEPKTLSPSAKLVAAQKKHNSISRQLQEKSSKIGKLQAEVIALQSQLVSLVGQARDAEIEVDKAMLEARAHVDSQPADYHAALVELQVPFHARKDDVVMGAIEEFKTQCEAFVALVHERAEVLQSMPPTVTAQDSDEEDDAMVDDIVTRRIVETQSLGASTIPERSSGPEGRAAQLAAQALKEAKESAAQLRAQRQSSACT